MWRRLKPSMPSFRRIDDLSIIRQIEPDKKGEEISDFLIFFSDYGMVSGDYRASDYGKNPGKPATFRLFQKPATFANMPATFQRLWGIPGKILEFPEKSAENRNFWEKMGQKSEKWGIFPKFPKFRGNISPGAGGFWGRFYSAPGACFGARFPSPGIGVFLGGTFTRGRAAAPAPPAVGSIRPQENRPTKSKNRPGTQAAGPVFDPVPRCLA